MIFNIQTNFIGKRLKVTICYIVYQEPFKNINLENFIFFKILSKNFITEGSPIS